MMFKGKYILEISGAFVAVLILLLFTLFKNPSVPSQGGQVTNKTKSKQVTSNLDIRDSYYKDYSLLTSRDLFSKKEKTDRKSTIKGLPPLADVLKKTHKKVARKKVELVLAGIFYDGASYHAVFENKEDRTLLFARENMRVNNGITILKIRKNVVELLKNGKKTEMQLFNINIRNKNG